MLLPGGDAFKLFESQTFRQRLFCIVVDEAHLIQDWYILIYPYLPHTIQGYYMIRGTSFRTAYAKLNALKSIVPPVPWMFLSATLTPFNRESILRLWNLRENDVEWIM